MRGNLSVRCLLAALAVLVAACSPSSAYPEGSPPASVTSASTTTIPEREGLTSPPSVPSFTTSLADRVCAEIEDPTFDSYPLDVRRAIRAGCKATRETEVEEEAARMASGTDAPHYEAPDPLSDYQPDYEAPEPEPPEPDD
jgi:hypothetical protein